MTPGARVAPVSKERSCLGKRRYWSRVDALVMAARCIERRNLAALAAYRCDNCAGWHLTRQLSEFDQRSTIWSSRQSSNDSFQS